MYACGYRNGVLEDVQRQNWQGSGFRPLVWSAWYPVAKELEDLTTQRTTLEMFEAGRLNVGLPPSSERCWPVILLSHGTGGSPESLGWLTVSRGRNALQDFRKRSHAGPYTCSIENCFPQPLCLRCLLGARAPQTPPMSGSHPTSTRRVLSNRLSPRPSWMRWSAKSRRWSK